MDKQEIQRMTTVMLAALDGKEIQVNIGDGWRTIAEPEWSWGLSDYRIKPPNRTFVIWITKDGSYMGVRTFEADKAYLRRDDCEYILVQEIPSI